MPLDSVKLHANAVIWNEAGFLIRGASASGKSMLASRLVAEGRRTGTFSRLVADDVVVLQTSGGRLIARPHPDIAGFIERRGLGIEAVEHEPACVVRLVLDLEAAVPVRLPDPDTLRVTILGIIVPRLPLWRDAPASDNVYRTLDFFAAFRACS